MLQPEQNPPNREDAPPVIVPEVRPPIMARAAPPTAPTYVARPQEPSRWPGAIGMVLIIVACFYLLGGVCGLMGPWLNEISVRFAPNAATEYAELNKRWQSWTLALAVMAIVLASVMLAAGIGVRGRRPWSIRLSRIWAAAQMALAIANAVVNQFVVSDTMKVMMLDASRRSSPIPGAFATGMQVGSKFTLVIGLAWGLALPVFVLIWLSRKRIRAEVAAWNDAASAGGERELPRV